MNDQDNVLVGGPQGQPQPVRNALPGKALIMLGGGPCEGERMVDVKEFEWPLPDALYVRREFAMVKGITADKPEIGEYEEWLRYDKLRDTSWSAGKSNVEGDAVIVGAVYAFAGGSGDAE